MQYRREQVQWLFQDNIGAPTATDESNQYIYIYIHIYNVHTRVYYKHYIVNMNKLNLNYSKYAFRL